MKLNKKYEEQIKSKFIGNDELLRDSLVYEGLKAH